MRTIPQTEANLLQQIKQIDDEIKLRTRSNERAREMKMQLLEQLDALKGRAPYKVEVTA
jgi:hypothetical protein